MAQKKKETAKKTPVSLRKCLDDFMKENNISEDQLEYHWKRLTARETDQKFNEFHAALETAVRDKKEDEIRAVIKEISKWGGIHAREPMLRDYSQKLLDLDENKPIGSEKRLASWTKVLAAYKPEKFCIYDSRVAFALRMLMRNKSWFLPPRRTKNNSYDHLKREKHMSPSESYDEYMRLLEGTGYPVKVKYERMLFMLGGVLLNMPYA